MNRRTVLKRLGAATAGTAVVGGTASAERELVEIDGEQYLVRADLDPETLDRETVDPERADSETVDEEIREIRTCYGPCYPDCDVCYA